MDRTRRMPFRVFRCQLLQHRFVAIIIAVLCAGFMLHRASAGETRIANSDDLPKYDQTHDYVAKYQNANTDIVINGNTIKYKDLATATAGGKRTNVDPNTVRFFVGNDPPTQPVPAPAKPLRLFTANDYTDLTGGTYHCYPTAER